MSPFAWTLLGVNAAAFAVWAWINFGGRYGRSARYRLPQPEAVDPLAQGSDAWVPPLTDANLPEANLPGVAILSPGRNEAEHLPAVLPELCEQDYPAHHVVFIDDASADETPAIAADLTERFSNLTVVRNDTEPPPGWMGKCWAIQRGYETLTQSRTLNQSKVDWLCFTDADIHWHPRLLRTAVEHALEHDADLVGVTPTLRFGSAAEAIVQLQLVLALGLMFPFEQAMDPETDFALTGGAFILVRRSLYDQIGGHEAVKGEMVEDLKLGAALKAAGAKHRVALAGDLQWCRMYDGPADMWEGLTKNAYAGLDHRWWKALPLCLAVLLFNVGPLVYAPFAAVGLILSPGWVAAIILSLALVTLLLQARALNAARKLMRLRWPYAWTLPIGSAACLVITLASIFAHHTRGNAWKGRRYPAHP
ncbi:MAG: glycosyltransferase family 2 protein [Planctomycetota bacterium]